MRMLLCILLLALAGCGKAAFIGDSITLLLADSLPQDEVSYAVNGYTTSQMLADQLPQVLANPPMSVVILGGTNDLARGQSSIADLQSMARLARAAGSCVILATLPPCDDQWCASRAAYDTWNAQVLIFAMLEHYPVADYRHAMSGSDGTQLPGLFFDGIHPSPAGAAVMQSIIQPIIRSCPHVVAAGG